MKIELVDITENSAEKIGRYAGICYGKDENNVMRCEKVVKYRHLSCLRFAYATFKVSEISRCCSMQVLRHKHLDYLQRSQRYVTEEQAQYVAPPSIAKDPELKAEFLADCEKCNEMYVAWWRGGHKPEDARYLLPNAIHTELYVTGNFEAWHHFIGLRLTKQAQWEIRGVAASIWSELYEHCPPVFQEFTEQHYKLYPVENKDEPD